VSDDLRSRKKRETRQALKSAALRLVDAYGLEHVTVEMVAAEADVSPRTFFNHFATKEDALLGPGVETRADLEQFWAQRPADETPLASLRALLLDRAAMVSMRSAEMDLRMRVLAANPALYVRFHASFLELERIVREGVAVRCGLDAVHDLYPAVVAAAGSAAMRVSMDLWRGGDDRPLTDIIDEVFRLYAAGLTPPPVPTPRARQRRHADITGKA
jgi:AcrR family transcriptional regulator